MGIESVERRGSAIARWELSLVLECVARRVRSLGLLSCAVLCYACDACDACDACGIAAVRYGYNAVAVMERAPLCLLYGCCCPVAVEGEDLGGLVAPPGGTVLYAPITYLPETGSELRRQPGEQIGKQALGSAKWQNIAGCVVYPMLYTLPWTGG